MGSSTRKLEDIKEDNSGVRFVDRGDGFILIQELHEDDETWYDGDLYSAYWLDEKIAVLQEAKELLEVVALKDKWGYKFSSE